jgi:hypothetical protein
MCAHREIRHDSVSPKNCMDELTVLVLKIAVVKVVKAK